MMNGRKAKYELNDEVAVILDTVIASGKVISLSDDGDTYTYGVALDDCPVVVTVDEGYVRDKSDYEPEDDEDYDDEDYDEYDEDDYEEDDDEDYPEVDDDDEDDEDECCCCCCHHRECCSPTPQSRTSHPMPIEMGVIGVEADSLPEAVAKMRMIMGM